MKAETKTRNLLPLEIHVSHALILWLILKAVLGCRFSQMILEVVVATHLLCFIRLSALFRIATAQHHLSHLNAIPWRHD